MVKGGFVGIWHWMRVCSLRSLILALALTGLACGIKAPPLPRDEVVPSPIREISIRQVEDGLYMEFTLPATSLDGSPLKRIGGYRIVRRGPGREAVKEDILFGVTQQMAMSGKKVSLELQAPERAGTYRFRVFPMDAYGSRPRRTAEVEFAWDGNKIVGPVDVNPPREKPSGTEAKDKNRPEGKEEK